MGLPREISLDSAEINAIMLEQWNMRVATIGPGARINLTPMWFGWAGESVYFFARGQKVVNLRRNTACSVIVDCNVRFPELRGIMLQGNAKVLEDVDSEAQDPYLREVQAQMGLKYDGGHGQAEVADPPPFAATARGRNRRWVVLTPEHVVSCDNSKLAS